MRTLWLLALLAASLAACSGDDPVGPAGIDVPSLPGRLVLTGAAFGLDGAGRSADCLLNLRVELNPGSRVVDGYVEYMGIHGGEVGRTVLDAAGNGFAFHADVFGEAVVRLREPDRIELRFPANEGVESRFWSGLAVFSGTLDGEGTGEGRWACAPFDIQQGGYIDTTLTVDGTWRLVPEAIVP